MKKAVLFLMLCVVGISGRASASTPSGMMLGIYANSSWNGLLVSGTIPGYPADGYLFAGDIVTRATADGHPIYNVRSMWDLEQLKSRIGPYRYVAMEVFRPSFGRMYMWVTFVPVNGGGVAMMQSAPVAGAAMKTRMFNESERPGASALFQKQVLKPVVPVRPMTVKPVIPLNQIQIKPVVPFRTINRVKVKTRPFRTRKIVWGH